MKDHQTGKTITYDIKHSGRKINKVKLPINRLKRDRQILSGTLKHLTSTSRAPVCFTNTSWKKDKYATRYCYINKINAYDITIKLVSTTKIKSTGILLKAGQASLKRATGLLIRKPT